MVSDVTSAKVSPSVVEDVSFEQLSKGMYLPPPMYPPQAVKDGIEGEVVVQLIIGRSGGIAEVSVIESSGYAALDEASVQVIKEEWVFHPHDTIRKTTKRFVFLLQ